MIEQSKVQACPLLCEEVPVTGVSVFNQKPVPLIEMGNSRNSVTVKTPLF